MQAGTTKREFRAISQKKQFGLMKMALFLIPAGTTKRILDHLTNNKYICIVLLGERYNNGLLHWYELLTESDSA